MHEKPYYKRVLRLFDQLFMRTVSVLFDEWSRKTRLGDMSPFQELDELLSSDEDAYYFNDDFLHAERLIEALAEVDIPLVVNAWVIRNYSWCDRFSQACYSIKQSVLLPLIEVAISTDQKISPTLGLLTHLPKQADHSDFYQLLLNYVENLWRQQPQLHLQVHMCAWSCGLSKRLLNRLGFKILERGWSMSCTKISPNNSINFAPSAPDSLTRAGYFKR